jgi:cytochrome P450
MVHHNFMSTQAEETAHAHLSCPFQHEGSEQKTAPPGTAGGPAVAQDADGVWHVRDLATARAILRADHTQQAGFRAEQVARLPGKMRPPILYQEGEAHRLQRTQIARFFTPATTSNKYRAFMTTFSDNLIEGLRNRKEADLSDISMQLAVSVAAEVVGLTNSRTRGMSQRIEAFFDQPDMQARGITKLLDIIRNQWRVMRFYLLDIKPAIHARKHAPQEDVISYLIDKGYSDPEILTECVTYAAAGMATTREFICVAAWHLLEQPSLKEQYLQADEAERHRVLHELLRLEPVVGNLHRRTQQPLTIDGQHGTAVIPAGARINLHIREANADEASVGSDPRQVCPGRKVASGVQPYALSFGDGHHRCPGAYVAIQETDIFLQRLLKLEHLRIVRPPTITWNELVAGYELRDFIVTAQSQSSLSF